MLPRRSPRCRLLFSLAASAALVAGITAGCTTNQPPSIDPEDRARASEMARAAVQALGLGLMGELSRALADGPPEGAIEVCAVKASEIADRISQEQGLTVRRTALRLRNPENAPADWERTVLDRWAASPDPATLEAHETVTPIAGGWELRRLQPIVLADLCITCHGPRSNFSPALRESLAKHYPEDAAVDFSAGELRGAFSVRVPIPGE